MILIMYISPHAIDCASSCIMVDDTLCMVTLCFSVRDSLLFGFGTEQRYIGIPMRITIYCALWARIRMYRASLSFSRMEPPSLQFIRVPRHPRA